MLAANDDWFFVDMRFAEALDGAVKLFGGHSLRFQHAAAARGLVDLHPHKKRLVIMHTRPTRKVGAVRAAETIAFVNECLISACYFAQKHGVQFA